MPRNTRNKTTKDNNPGNAGGKEYGLVKIGFSIEDLVKGENRVFIQKPNGEWMVDEDFVRLVIEGGVARPVMEGIEVVNNKHWYYKVFAVPREFLRGREDYAREWVGEEELPTRIVRAGVERRIGRDGVVEIISTIEEDKDKKEGNR